MEIGQSTWRHQTVVLSQRDGSEEEIFLTQSSRILYYVGFYCTFIILDSAGPHQDLSSCQFICNLLHQINHVCMYVCMYVCSFGGSLEPSNPMESLCQSSDESHCKPGCSQLDVGDVVKRPLLRISRLKDIAL